LIRAHCYLLTALSHNAELLDIQRRTMVLTACLLHIYIDGLTVFSFVIIRLCMSTNRQQVHSSQCTDCAWHSMCCFSRLELKVDESVISDETASNHSNPSW